MCLLTPYIYASYAVSVRQYRILQSRFLQCIPRGKPPCDLLMLRAQLVPLSNGNPAHKGFSPSGKKNHPRTIGIFNKICKFDIFTDLRWWVHCSCRAHTRAYVHRLADVHFAGFAPAFTLSQCDSEYSRKPPNALSLGRWRSLEQAPVTNLKH